MNTCERLQEQVNYQEQALLRRDIEIAGITESTTENPHYLLLTLATVAGVKLADADIDSVVRAGPPRKNIRDLPGPLVVRFCRRHTRDQFYKAVKSKRLTTEHLGIDGPSSKIYFNDRLTRDNRHLFRECRAQFKAAGYKYCWTKRGQIYVKKYEGKGEGSEAIIVRSLGHMARILQNTDSTPAAIEIAGVSEEVQREV
jgi:hypothetical protein